jgi:hypothetical protein
MLRFTQIFLLTHTSQSNLETTHYGLGGGDMLDWRNTACTSITLYC